MPRALCSGRLPGPGAVPRAPLRPPTTGGPRADDENANGGAPGTSGTAQAGKAEGAGGGLLTSVMKRLRKAEAELKAKTTEADRRGKQVGRLEAQVAELEGLVARLQVQLDCKIARQDRAGSADGILKEELKVARKGERLAWEEVAAMKEFLTSQGIKWLGAGLAPERQAAPAGRAAPAPPRLELSPFSDARGHITVDIVTLKDRISQLNTIAGEDGGRPGRRGPAESGEAVALTLFKDGVTLHTSPFLSLEEPETHRVLQDIMDGYFPSVLRADFPDGVAIRLVDRRAALHRTEAGQRPLANVKGLNNVGTAAGPASPKEFLKKLPATVIRNGKIVDVRAGVRDMLLGGGGNAKSLVATPVDSLLSQSTRFSTGPTARVAAPAPAPSGCEEAEEAEAAAAAGAGRPEISTLQVKSEDGRNTYVLRLQASDTIQDLRDALNAYRAKAEGKGRPTRFQIKSAWPNRTFGEGSRTLKEEGLVPNATLFLQV